MKHKKVLDSLKKFKKEKRKAGIKNVGSKGLEDFDKFLM